MGESVEPRMLLAYHKLVEHDIILPCESNLDVVLVDWKSQV